MLSQVIPTFLWNFFKKPSDCFKLFVNSSAANNKEGRQFSIFQMGYAPTAWEKKAGGFVRGSELEREMLGRHQFGKSVSGGGVRDSEHIFNIIGADKNRENAVSLVSN
jgi:hypothetical protein